MQGFDVDALDARDRQGAERRQDDRDDRLITPLGCQSTPRQFLLLEADDQIGHHGDDASGHRIDQGVRAPIDHPSQLGGLETRGGKAPNGHGADRQPALPTLEAIVQNEAAVAGRGDANAEAAHVIAALRSRRIATLEREGDFPSPASLNIMPMGGGGK